MRKHELGPEREVIDRGNGSIQSHIGDRLGSVYNKMHYISIHPGIQRSNSY